MKHKFIDDVNANANVNVTLDIPTQELENLIEKITDSAITIIVVASTAHILRKWMT